MFIKRPLHWLNLQLFHFFKAPLRNVHFVLIVVTHLDKSGSDTDTVGKMLSSVSICFERDQKQHAAYLHNYCSAINTKYGNHLEKISSSPPTIDGKKQQICHARKQQIVSSSPCAVEYLEAFPLTEVTGLVKDRTVISGIHTDGVICPCR